MTPALPAAVMPFLPLLLIPAILAGIAVALAWLRRALRAPRLAGIDDPATRGVRAEPVRLITSNGRRLFAWFCPPADPTGRPPRPAAGVVAIHGWGGNADGLLPLARTLQADGVGVLLVEARCHGRSEDDTFASLPRFAEDLSSGVDWMGQRPGIDPRRIVVMGHSVGGGAALLVGSRRRDLAGVISLSAFAHPEEVMRQFLERLRIPYRPLGWLVNRYVERVIGHRFRDIAPLSTVTRQHAPVLLMHGEADRVVPVTDMRRLESAGRAAGRSIHAIVLPGVDHEGVRQSDGTLVLDEGAARMGAFLADLPPAEPASAPAASVRSAPVGGSAAPHRAPAGRPAPDVGVPRP